jgi:general secretion pathway protein G
MKAISPVGADPRVCPELSAVGAGPRACPELSAVGAGPRACPPKIHPDSAVRAVRRRAAFTLIEIMIVIVIIMILVGIVIHAAKYAQTKAATSRAQAEIASMETALESYKSDNGVYPNTGTIRTDVQSNSAVLYNALATGPKKYFMPHARQLQPVVVGGVTTTNIMDPFGHPYNYYQTNDPTLVTNVATFDLWSYGPSGTNNDPNMITNWKQ